MDERHIPVSQCSTPPRTVVTPQPFDLKRTAAPIAWGRGRWPNVHWAADAAIWCGRDGETVVWRSVSQSGEGELRIEGTANPADDLVWVGETFGLDIEPPAFGDEVLDRLARRHAGMRPFAHGSLWEGVASSIVGQGVSVAGGATLLSRIAALVHPGVALAGRTLWPMPAPAEIAALGVDRLRATGLTRQRAEALAATAEAMRDGDQASGDPERFRADMVAIRGIGPWTIASALLWGVAAADIHPSGDVALLRAARHAFGQPSLSMRELDAMSDRWRPYRGWAARLLWLELLGPAE